MIGKSLPEFIFIRLSILGLGLIAPLSILYLMACIWCQQSILPIWATVYCALEAASFLLIYLPRRSYLQKPALHPEIPDREGRRKLLHRCADEVTSSNVYSGWFHSPVFSRENAREWLLWALFSSRPEDAQPEWEEEIEEYIAFMEADFGEDFAFQEANSKSMRLTLDPVVMLHRPLLWYLIVGFVDAITSLSLRCRGFKHYNSTGLAATFPLRPMTSLCLSSPSSNISYWYRPHTSETKKPIVFIHGIGIGLWPYITFFKSLICDDPTVGILLIEIMPISMHISKPVPPREIMVRDIHAILSAHKLDNVVLASHSYGTVVSTHLLHHPLTSPLIASTLFIDPIPFLLHIPDVAYNFVYRSPRTANEWQLWYFASRDPDISRTLSRHFFWHENIMWRDDLVKMMPQKKFAVVLSEEDQIVNARMVRRYLTRDEEVRSYWCGEGGNLEVIWVEGADHATVLDTKERRQPLLDVLGRFVQEPATEIVPNGPDVLVDTL